MFIRRFYAAGCGWAEDNAAQMGAALAYYALFSLTPTLVLAVGLLSQVYGEQEGRQQVITQVSRFLDESSAEAVAQMLTHFRGSEKLTQYSLIGLASLLFGASGMFNSLRTSLTRIWRLPPSQDGFFFGFFKDYLLAAIMVFVSCVFLIVLMFVSLLMPLVYTRWAEQFPDYLWAAPLLDLLISTLLLMLLFAFTFRILSDGRLGYSQLWSGALTTALLFTLGKMLIGIYLAQVDLASAYGAAGSLVVVLAWVYYSAQIVFFGAEVVRFGLPSAKAEG